MSIRERIRKVWRKLDDSERAWLYEVYRSNQEGCIPSSREVRGRLWDELPAGFDPDDIDARLLQQSTRVTLLGRLAADPGSNLLQEIGAVISAIKDCLRDDPKRESVAAEELIVDTDLPEGRIRVLLDYIYRDLAFAKGASGGSRGKIGLDSIAVAGDAIFEAYRSYQSIETILEERYFSERHAESPGPTVDKRKPQPEQHVIRPIFRSHVAHVDQTMCFVLMPFSEEWSDDIYDVVDKIVGAEGYDAIRADESHGSFIREDIWTKINQATFIIADITGQNPNVMYELGIAHTVGKPVVMIAQDVSSAPFDFRHLRIVEYSGLAGSEQLRERLPGAIKTALEEYDRRNSDGTELNVVVPGSPVYFQMSEFGRRGSWHTGLVG